MNIRQTIRKVLNEEKSVNDTIKSILEKFYVVDFDIRATHFDRMIYVDVRIRPKKFVDREQYNQYAYYGVFTKTGKFEEENSAYMDGGFFREIGLEKPFTNYIRSLAKEKAKDLTQ
jgi:hypothetical protein